MAKPVVFVIDDHLVARRLVMQILGDNYQFLEAESGDRAIEMLNDGLRPDIILCDFHMPGLDGLEFYKAKSKIAGCATIPTIMVTASHSNDLREISKMVGVKDWIVKPIDKEQLTTAVEAVMGRCLAVG